MGYVRPTLKSTDHPPSPTPPFLHFLYKKAHFLCLHKKWGRGLVWGGGAEEARPQRGWGRPVDTYAVCALYKLVSASFVQRAATLNLPKGGWFVLHAKRGFLVVFAHFCLQNVHLHSLFHGELETATPKTLCGPGYFLKSGAKFAQLLHAKRHRPTALQFAVVRKHLRALLCKTLSAKKAYSYAKTPRARGKLKKVCNTPPPRQVFWWFLQTKPPKNPKMHNRAFWWFFGPVTAGFAGQNHQKTYTRLWHNFF